ncbi:unnamed protein product [Durusdinium trenchii]|uniref:Uncharacterized protein n=1 Tax=Durusdinium trenchii TaxID=1381693 RepID=A0ABP0NZB0_9DINO
MAWQRYRAWDIAFCSFGNVVSTGQQRHLESEDALQLCQGDTPLEMSEKIGDSWRRRSETEKLVFVTSAWEIHKHLLIRAGIFHALEIGMGFVAPRMIKPLIDNLDSAPSTSLVYAAGVALGPIIVSLSNSQFDMTSNRIGYRCTGGYTCFVFNKILRLSQTSLASYGQGKLVNIMQVDTQRVSRAFFFFFYLWSMPLMLIGILILLFDMLGWACLMPIFVMFCTYKFNSLLTTRLMTLGAGLNRCRDHRVKLFTEVLHALRLCKMLAWEHQLADMIDVKRREEMKLLNNFKSWQTVLSLLFGGSATAIVQLATFSAYILLGGQLTAGIVFSSLAIFDMLQLPMSLLPITVQYLAQTYVSVLRIEKLLRAEEVDHRAPEVSFIRARPVNVGGKAVLAPVRIQNAQFLWPRTGEEDSDEELPQAPQASSTGQRRRCCERFRRRQQSEALLESPDQLMNTIIPQRAPQLSIKAFQLLHGKFVLVTGPVGSGKSTLLSSILGEVPQLAGALELLGSVAYCAQIPWILQGTVQHNITFGDVYDAERFSQVVDACSLAPDLRQLSNGADTVIGERGITLSGGQKARISLARAAYSQASVYLLDDPLSAVDAHVAAHLVSKCLGPQGYLSKQSRILVSHQTQFASEADLVLIMRNGEIVAAGPAADFSKEELQSATVSEKSTDWTSRSTSTATAPRAGPVGLSRAVSAHGGPKTEALELRRAISEPSEEVDGVAKEEDEERKDAEVDGEEESTPTPGAVIQEIEERAEDMEEGHLSLRVWCTFMRAMGCGAFWVIVLNLISTVGYLVSALWLGHWPELQAQMGTGDALAVYAVIAFSILFFTLLRILMFQWSSLALAISMHQKALWAVLRSPMSWLDTTPGGRIINRFSSDMSKIDLDLQGSMQNLLRAVCDLFASIMVAGAVLPLIFLIFVPILLAYHWIQKVYRKAGREIQRLASKARSPIYQGVDEAIVGVTTIRAYDKQQYFMDQNERRVSRSLRLDFTQMGCQKWLGFRLKALGSIVSMLVALLVVLHRSLGPLGRAISGPAAGLALRYAQQLSNAMEGILNNLTMAEQCLVAVERLNTYMEMEDEGSLETDFDSSITSGLGSAPADGQSSTQGFGWLVDGSVRFENVVMRYREGTPLVLKGLSFEIPGGSSLGIVGRTGAGKSSLLQVLFRMSPLESGAVYLDGHDTSKMPGFADLDGFCLDLFVLNLVVHPWHGEKTHH